MKRPIPVSERIDRQLLRDIGFLFIASCFVLVQLFDYRLAKAVLHAPVIVLGFLVGLYLLVQLSWLVVVLVDRLLGRLKSQSPLN